MTIAITIAITGAIATAIAARSAGTAAADPLDALHSLSGFDDRVHLSKVTGLRLGPDRIEAVDREGVHDLATEWIVIEREPGWVRIVLDGDDARLLPWIRLDDAAWSVARETRVAGPPEGEAGVWLERGAPVEVRGRGARRRVVFDDGGVRVTGVVPASALTKVFAVPADGTKPDHTARRIHTTPGGPVLIEAELGIRTLARGPPGWTLVEHRGRYLRVRGWTHDHDLDPDLMGFGTGSGGGYGISDTQRVEIPAGTCLFDRRGGVPVGVELATRVRYAFPDDDGWWAVYVGTPWQLLTVHVHDLGPAPGRPSRWLRCR